MKSGWDRERVRIGALVDESAARPVPQRLHGEMTKRAFDVLFALLVLPVAAVLILVSAVAIAITDPGPVVHWSERVGRDNRRFRMAKLRTMKVGCPDVATHLLVDRDQWVTRVGRVLRALSLDELPQFFHVLRGDMSLVGPRPALHNQDDLVSLRTQAGVHRLRPGLTGLAQISGRDELSVEEKVELDQRYLAERNLFFDVKVLLRTIVPVISGRSLV